MKTCHVIIGQDSFTNFKTQSDFMIKSKGTDDDIVFILNGVLKDKEKYDEYLRPHSMFFLIIANEEEQDLQSLKEKANQLVEAKSMDVANLIVC